MTKIICLLVVMLAVILLPAAASSVTETRLTNDSAVSRQPDTTVSGNYTYVVWSDSRDGNYEIYYKLLDDGSESVSDTRLTSTGASSITPSVAVDSTGDVHVVWREGDDIYYLKADSTGTLLISPKRISELGTVDGGRCWNPDIATGLDGVVHVVWTRKNYNICIRTIYIVLTETGDVSTKTQLSVHMNNHLSRFFGGGYPTHPHIAIDSMGDSHVVFCDLTGDQWEMTDDSCEIFYSVVQSDGNISINQMQLTEDMVKSYHPTVCVDSDDGVHIAWYDKQSGNYDIYYAKLGEIDQRRLTFGPADSIDPCIASDGCLIHLAWAEQDENSSLVYQELYKTGNIIRMGRFTTDNSTDASVALDGGVVWTDQRDGNNEIYHGKMQMPRILIAHPPDRLTAQNQNATYHLNIINTGDSTATATLSVVNMASASIAVLNRSSVIIPPHSSSGVTLNVTDCDLGEYVVRVIASDGGDIFESEDIYTSVAPPTVDLTVDRVDAYYHELFGCIGSTRRHLNLVNHVRVVVRNNGSLNCDTFNITLMSNDAVVCTETVSSLGAQSSTVVLFDWTPIHDVLQPSGSVTATFVLTAEADPDDVISESDEVNNDRTLYTNAVWNGYMGGNGVLGDAYLTTKHHDKLRGGVIYDMGDNHDHEKTPAAYPVNYDITLPPNSTIELAKVYVYFEWYADSKPYLNVSFTNSTGTYNITSEEENWYWDKAYIGGSANALWGMFAYNITSYIVDGGVHTTNIATPDTCIDGALLFIVYSNPEMPEIEYWMSEGADVLMGGDRFGSNGLHSEDCVARANLTGGTIDLGRVVNTTLLSVSNCADSHAGGSSSAILFNGNTLGWNCFQGAGGTGYTSAVGWNVTSVPVEYLKPDSNLVELADCGDNMMPANALLIVEYGGCEGGDLNHDGDVADAADVTMMIQAFVGDLVPNSEYDLNKDGDDADAADVTMMIQAFVGDITL